MYILEDHLSNASWAPRTIPELIEHFNVVVTAEVVESQTFRYIPESRKTPFPEGQTTMYNSTLANMESGYTVTDFVFSVERVLAIDKAAEDLPGSATEAVSGNLDQALLLFDAAIDSLYRAGNVGHLALAIARLAVVFDQLDRPDIAATLYGACTRHSNIVIVTSLPAVVEQLRAVLGESAFTGRVDAGAAELAGDASRRPRADRACHARTGSDSRRAVR